MAMTKKEQAAMQAAIDRAETLAALRWTAPVPKDVPPPQSSSYSEGWNYNAYSKSVNLGWSTSVSHGDGPAPTDGKRSFSGSQNSCWMFSTEEKALQAMRHEIEQQSAKTLLAIDRRIEALRASALSCVGGV